MVTIRDNIGLADAATSTQTGTVGEPSAAASWSGMFITGNWYASRSADAGRTWTFVDPFTSFPADRGEFCCDQLVLWEPKRKFWVWLLQYSQLGGTNIFRVAVSPDAAPGSWHTWEVTPADVNPTWKSWFDYPDMAVSDDHLYISFNQYSTSDAWLRASVFRYSLDELDGLARGRTGPLTREQWTTTATRLAALRRRRRRHDVVGVERHRRGGAARVRLAGRQRRGASRGSSGSARGTATTTPHPDQRMRPGSIAATIVSPAAGERRGRAARASAGCGAPDARRTARCRSSAR